MRTLLLAALLCACSASTGAGQYRQSAPMAPAFAPVEDAPHTLGQPGYVQSTPVERSPHTRVLPPTKEPGLWAGDTRASIKSRPTILTEEIPLPRPEDADLPVVRECASLFTEALTDYPQVVRRFLALTPRQRECVALRRFEECASHQGANFDARRLSAFVAAQIRAKCKQPTDEEEDIAGDMLVALVKYIDGGGGHGRTRH